MPKLQFRVVFSIICGLTLGYFYWLVSNSTWGIFFESGRGRIFDALFLSLRDGRLDLPFSLIRGEHFLVNGKYYAYFGPVPAMLRVLLLPAFPALFGMTAPLMSFAGLVVTFAAALGLPEYARRALGYGHVQSRWSALAWVLFAGAGSTLALMTHPVNVYREAIIWGVAFACVAINLYLRFIVTERLAYLVAGVIINAFSLLSRPVDGLALTAFPLALGFFALAFRQEKRMPASFSRLQALLVLLLAMVSISAYAMFNIYRFNTINGQPIELYNISSTGGESAMYDVKGRSPFDIAATRWPVSWKHVLPNLKAYLDPRFIDLNSSPPYIRLVHPREIDPDRRFGESLICIAGLSPHLCILAMAGVVLLLMSRAQTKRWLLLLVFCTWMDVLMVASYWVVTLRYLHDFYPFLITSAAFGMVAIDSASRVARRICYSVLLLAALWGGVLSMLISSHALI